MPRITRRSFVLGMGGTLVPGVVTQGPIRHRIAQERAGDRRLAPVYANCADLCTDKYEVPGAGRAGGGGVFGRPAGAAIRPVRQVERGPGLLVNWINGAGTGPLKDATVEKQTEFTLTELSRICPESGKLLETIHANNWGNTYAEGAYAHYAPGQMVTSTAEIAKPAGCLHFAGEHTEFAAPGMEGALMSGRREAGEVLKKVQLAA